MANLTQIAFDFSTTEVNEPKPAYTAPKPPATTLVEEDEVIDLRIEEKPEHPLLQSSTKKKSTRGRKSLKESSAEILNIDVPEDDLLFQKKYYTIGDTAKMFNVNASLLRFWENEFDILKPRKNRKGDRYFRPEDIKNLQLIHDLLRRRKFTIEGAKDFLKQNKLAEEKFQLIQSMEQVKQFFLELKASL